jgi:hypothetical protein
MVGKEKRMHCGMVIQFYFSLGEIIVSGLAFWLRDWRLVIIVSAAPLFLFFLYWPILPESIR